MCGGKEKYRGGTLIPIQGLWRDMVVSEAAKRKAK